MSILQHIDKVEVFMTIIEAGSLHAASRRIGVSQPALSQTIKSLEKSVGCPLIVRSRDGVELTKSGRVYYEFARRILKEVRDLELKFDARHLEVPRNIRVGIFESIAIYAWPKAQLRLRKLLEKGGGADTAIELITGRTDILLKKLAMAEIDVAVVVDPVTTDLQVKELLFKDSFYLYCSPLDPGRAGVEEKKKAVDRCTRPLFLFESARVSEDNNLKASYPAIDVQFDSVNRVDSFEVAAEFVRVGLGFALLPERVAAKDPKNFHKVQIAGKNQKPVATHSICAVAPHSIAMTVAFQYLCQSLKSV